jgi:cell fate regulator YaaT (PSP1 superfamily)
MQTIVGIRFKKAGKIYYFEPGDISLETGSFVIVETSRGQEFGEVVVGPKEVADNEVIHPLKKVLRRADEEDCQRILENRQKEEEAFDAGLQKIGEHNLDMKLVDVEYTFDRSKIIFYFTADGRIDFRELVKDLASVFRTRIELRQIGVRDEAKMIGGLGPCGRILCCHTFLGEFEPVSIRMAKDQNLSLNPTKISGVCGRLMCCLRYESDTYEQARSEFNLARREIIVDPEPEDL